MKLLTLKPAKPSVLAKFFESSLLGYALVSETLEEDLLIEQCPPIGWRIAHASSGQRFCILCEDRDIGFWDSMVPIYSSLSSEKCRPGAEFVAEDGFIYEVVSVNNLTIKEGWKIEL